MPFARIATVTLAAAVTAAACSSGSVAPRDPVAGDLALPAAVAEAAAAPGPDGFDLPDVTARPITIDDLAAMLPPGDSGVTSTADPVVTTERSNEWLVTEAVLDREDEAADVEDFARSSGVGATYLGPVFAAHVWIDVLSDDSSGHRYLVDTAGDAVKGVGGTHDPGVLVTEAVEYPVSAGEEAIGLIASLDGGATETIVLFRVGRLVVFTSVERPDTADARVAVQHLADEVTERILAVLVGADPDTPPVAGPTSFRFAYELSVTGPAGASRTLTADGKVMGSDLECRVRTSGPEGPGDRDLVVVGGRMWTRDHDAGEYRGVGTGMAPDRALLAWCPPWPIEADRAGLTAFLDTAPASADLETGPAFGYRIDRDGLAKLLGTDLGDASVDVFNVWVSAGTPWIVDLGLTVTGTAGELAGLTGGGFAATDTIRVTLRQRVFDLGSVTEPVTSPGL